MRYKYKAWEVKQVVAFFATDAESGSMRPAWRDIEAALSEGYRWVKTECGMAVFEIDVSDRAYLTEEHDY